MKPGTSDGSPPEDVTAGTRGLGLATKYFLMAASLIVLAIGSAVAVTAYSANRVADRTVREALSQVGRVWKSFLVEREVSLQGRIRTLADEPQTRALLAEKVTPETVRDWVTDKTQAVAASFLVVLDSQGSIVARSDKPIEEVSGRSLAHARFVMDAIAGKESSALVREGKQIFIVASAPVASGEGDDARLEGVIFGAYPLDDEAARAVATLSGSDATFVSNVARQDERPRPEVMASTLGIDTEPFVRALASDPAAVESLLGGGSELGPLDLFPGGDHRIAVGFPLTTGSGEVIGAFLASRSLRRAKAAFTQIQRTLVGVGLVSLILAVPAFYLFGRRIARPLKALAASAHAVGEGNLDVRIPLGGTDEVGQLARSFAWMIAELREKAELENLIAGLGGPETDVAIPTSSGGLPSGDPEPETLATQTRRPFPPEGTDSLARPGPSGPRADTPRSHPPTVEYEGKVRVGAVLGGRYEIESLLGRGGMGLVWRAKDRELDEDVALKLIRDDMVVADSGLASRLKEEIKLARRITHPNVLRTHDFGDLDGVRFISMEFVPGPTLRRVVDRRGPLPLAVGLQLGRQICRGLAAAHEAGVIHRDIKPQNILIGPNGVAKIMDFGIAFSSQATADGLWARGALVGTPDYMSPEQIEGRSIDARTDIYSVGIVLYEMFTGRRPLPPAASLQSLRENLKTPPTPLRQVRPEMPVALERLIQQATAPMAEARFQSAAALHRALEKISA